MLKVWLAVLSFGLLVSLAYGATTTSSSANAEATPEATPESTPEVEPSKEEGADSEILRDLETFYNWLQNNPEYVAMAGMGLVILLLFIIILVILCQYTGRKNADKYREKA